MYSRVNDVYCYIYFLILMAFTLCISSVPARAAEDKDGGVPVIGGVLFPSLGVSSSYNDNVLLQDNNNKDSFVIVTSPRAKYYSEGDVTQFVLDMGIDDGYYTHSHNDNYFDLDANSKISFYPTERLTLFGGASYKKGHIARGQGNQSGLRALRFNRPDRFRQWKAETGIEYGLKEVGMPRIEVGYVHDEIRYSNNRDRTRFQERDTNNINTTLFYQVFPNTSMLVEGSLARFSYREGTENGDLDSIQYSILAGLSWQATYQTEGYFKVGYNQKFFDAEERNESAGISWAVGVDWKPLSYSTVSFLTSQSIREANGLGSDANTTIVELSWNHNWQEWLGTTARFYYTNEDFSGSNINVINDIDDSFRDRTDDNFGAELSLDYEFRRWLSLGLDYSYTFRDSSVSGSDYERNVIGVHALFSL